MLGLRENKSTMKLYSRSHWLASSLFFFAVTALLSVAQLAGQAAPPVADQAAANRDHQSSPTSSPGHKTPVPCRGIRYLRDLASSLNFFTNPRTGDDLEYTVIGDAAQSDELIVMFPGTGETLPDWPIQMLTNARYSPRIARTLAYLPSENGSVSLCHSYRLLLLDLPGVGKSQSHGNVTADQTVNDIDAMLDDAARTYAISTSRVDLVGWSLGTMYALKYALLAPIANRSRTVRSLVLIAAKPGGNTNGVFDGNEAQCVSTILSTLKSVPNADRDLKLRLQTDAFELTFPYRHQKPYDGVDSGCTASVDVAKRELKLNVETSCAALATCRKTVAEQLLNRRTWPWSLTNGIPDELYVQQRELAFDYSLCYCSAAGPDFQSSGCNCSQPAQMSEANGGVCQTNANPPNRPVSTNCAPLHISGTMTVINGPEDLYIQHVYGKALIDAYRQQLGEAKAQLVTYPGNDGAGHGVLLQHPKWTQMQIWSVLNR
jgi:pimeloyl-ACP methyl ester carboxylesterase